MASAVQALQGALEGESFGQWAILE